MFGGYLIFNGEKVLDLVKPFYRSIIFSILLSIPVYFLINAYSEEINKLIFNFKGYKIVFGEIGEKHSSLREMSGSLTFLCLFIPLIFLFSILITKNYYKDRQILNFYLKNFLYLKIFIFFSLLVTSLVLGVELFNWDMEKQYQLDSNSSWGVKTDIVISHDEMMKNFRFWMGWSVLNFVCITTVSYLLSKFKSLFLEYFKPILVFLSFTYVYLLFSKVSFWLFEKWIFLLAISATYFFLAYVFFNFSELIKRKSKKDKKDKKYYI